MPLINERESREPFDWLRRSPFSGSPVVDPHECDCGIPVGCDTTSYGEVLFESGGNITGFFSGDCGGTIVHPDGDSFFSNSGGGDNIPAPDIQGVVAGQTYRFEGETSHSRPAGGSVIIQWTDGAHNAVGPDIPFHTVVGCVWVSTAMDLVAPVGATGARFYQIGSLGTYLYAHYRISGPVVASVSDVCAAINDHEEQIDNHEDRIDDLETAPPAHTHTHASTTGQTANDHHAQLHASAHASGGGDAVKLDDLATPDDNTDLNVSTTRHGLVPKLPNDSAQYLDGTGAYSVPPGDSGSSTDHVHVVDEQISGDGTITVFPLDQEAVAESAIAYVSGVRTSVTVTGALNDEITFATAPAAGTNNISIDYVAVAT